MPQKSHRLLFTVAAIFNWVIGLGLLLDAPLILGLMGVSPLPTEPTFVRIVGGLVHPAHARAARVERIDLTIEREV